jgi:hypothetical protein
MEEKTRSLGILPSCGGEHSDLLHSQVLELLLEMRHEWVWAGDKFCAEQNLHWTGLRPLGAPGLGLEWPQRLNDDALEIAEQTEV